MMSEARLQLELLRWFFNVTIVVPAAFLVNLIPMLKSMSEIQSSSNQINLTHLIISKYDNSIGNTGLVLFVSLSLALLWHIPRILTANLERKIIFLDSRIIMILFPVSIMISGILLSYHSHKCELFYEELKYMKYGTFPLRCGSENVVKYIEQTVSFIWILYFVFSILYILHLLKTNWSFKKNK
jgi:hypothetical protein